jgi:hypothetical protein
MIMPHRRRVRRAAAATGGGGGGGGGYIANAVNFDGANDYLTRGADLTGQANSNFALVSFWFNMNGSNGVQQRMFGDNGGPNIHLNRDVNNKFVAIFINSAQTLNTWALVTTPQYSTTVNPGWHHVLISIDGGTGRRQIYIDDAVPALTTSTINAGNIGWNQAGITDWAIGAVTNGSQKSIMDIAEFYINSAASLDLSVETNRRKFIDASGKPVDLGSDGSTPTGTSPILFLSGPTVGWHTNKGTGGGFTENGALTTASTSPSD